jgi:hypothetical protein
MRRATHCAHPRFKDLMRRVGCRSDFRLEEKQFTFFSLSIAICLLHRLQSDRAED